MVVDRERIQALSGTVIAALLLLSACTASAGIDTAGQPTTTDRTTVDAVEPTAVAVETPVLLEPTATSIATPPPEPAATPIPAPLPEPTATSVPTPAPEPTATPIPLAAVADVDHSGLAGTRGLTLQWISWEPQDWGSIEFVPLVDGSYSVSGTQRGPQGTQYLEVDGTIVRVNDRELLFDGVITLKLNFQDTTEPCVREGQQTFLATGNRQFWRMQDLTRCNGLTDYVDIYFG